MGERLFGTDGIRGVFGEPPLDRSTVTALGLELGRRLLAGSPRPRVVLGGDTRDSTPELCSWLIGALRSTGCDTRFAGVIPTPGIAYLTRELDCAAGIAVSASHNPHPDNGIKLFGADGRKWAVEVERELEIAVAEMAATPATAASGVDTPEAAPDVEAPKRAEPSLLEGYLEHLMAELGPGALVGMRVILDSAHGAAAGLAGRLFSGLGAMVDTLGDRPDGRNINLERGSTHPETMAARTVAAAARLGFAFDGDADRVIVADEHGTIRDGDALLYLLALDLLDRGELDPPRIVATSMSNLGLEVALAQRGVEVVRCDVGDRVVVETLHREGLLLGGEQSGHIIHLGRATTGDGLLTALLTAEIVARTRKPLSAHLQELQRYPQVLLNVRVRDKPDLLTLPPVASAAREVEESLGARGRLVLRYSGTEPLARVMIEGPELPEVERLATHLADAIADEIGLSRPSSGQR